MAKAPAPAFTDDKGGAIKSSCHDCEAALFVSQGQDGSTTWRHRVGALAIRVTYNKPSGWGEALAIALCWFAIIIVLYSTPIVNEAKVSNFGKRLC